MNSQQEVLFHELPPVWAADSLERLVSVWSEKLGSMNTRC